MKRFGPYEPHNPYDEPPRHAVWPLVACAVAAIAAPLALILIYDFWRVIG